jgi:ferritin-like protein
MAKEDHLTNRELASQAGKNSGVARREQRAMRELMLEALNSQTPEQQIEKLKKYFPNLPDNASNLIGMFHRAMVEAHNGNVKAFKTICELAGILEQNININGNIQNNNVVQVNFIKPDDPKD